MLGVVENMNVNQIGGGARVGHVRGGASQLKKSSLSGSCTCRPGEDTVPALNKLTGWGAAQMSQLQIRFGTQSR